VRCLMEARADPCRVSADGAIPVLSAAGRGHQATAKLLWEHTETFEAAGLQKDLQLLVPLVPQAQLLQRLQLEQCGTESASGQLLAQLCTKLSASDAQLDAVVLRGCFYTEEQALVAAGALGRLSLRELGLQRCKLEAAGARALASSTMHTLDLSYNPHLGSGMRDVCHALSGAGLRRLALRGCGLTDDCAPFLGTLVPGLQALVLAENDLGDQAAVQLAEVLASCGLALLDLQRTAVGLAGASALARAVTARGDCTAARAELSPSRRERANQSDHCFVRLTYNAALQPEAADDLAKERHPDHVVLFARPEAELILDF